MGPWARRVKETPLVRLSALRRARGGKPESRGALAHFSEGKKVSLFRRLPGCATGLRRKKVSLFRRLPGCTEEKGFPISSSYRVRGGKRFPYSVVFLGAQPGCVGAHSRSRDGPVDSQAERRGFHAETNPGVPPRHPEFRGVPRHAAAPRYTGCPVCREAAGGGIAPPVVRRSGGRMPTGVRAVSPARWCGAVYDPYVSVAPPRTRVHGCRPLPGADGGPTCGPP